MHDFKVVAEDFLNIINQAFIKKSVSGCVQLRACVER